MIPVIIFITCYIARLCLTPAVKRAKARELIGAEQPIDDAVFFIELTIGAIQFAALIVALVLAWQGQRIW